MTSAPVMGDATALPQAVPALETAVSALRDQLGQERARADRLEGELAKDRGEGRSRPRPPRCRYRVASNNDTISVLIGMQT